MRGKLFFLFILIAASLFACNKGSKNSGCAANQICTAEFVSIGVQFVDNAGNAVEVKDITVVNLRSNQPVVAKNVIDPGFSPDLHVIATDSNKDDFSATGDDVKVTATSATTNKTVSAMLKISGGCKCHIAKLSGPDKIVFQ